jgi:hypothetical protein
LFCIVRKHEFKVLFQQPHVNWIHYEFDDTQPHEEAVVQEDDLAAAKDKKRSRNFSVDQDKLLVSSWLNVSQDPIQGVDQERDTY